MVQSNFFALVQGEGQGREMERPGTGTLLDGETVGEGYGAAGQRMGIYTYEGSGGCKKGENTEQQSTNRTDMLRNYSAESQHRIA